MLCQLKSVIINHRIKGGNIVHFQYQHGIKHAVRFIC